MAGMAHRNGRGRSGGSSGEVSGGWVVAIHNIDLNLCGRVKRSDSQEARSYCLLFVSPGLIMVS